MPSIPGFAPMAGAAIAEENRFVSIGANRKVLDIRDPSRHELVFDISRQIEIKTAIIPFGKILVVICTI